MKPFSFKIWIVTLFLCFTLTACNEVELLQGLDQRAANEILVVLGKNNIKATIVTVTKQQKSTWSITVSSKDESLARQVLLSHNLPRKEEPGLKGICETTGMIPTPEMQKCQMILGIQGDITNNLRRIKGVVDANVVISIPDKSDFPDPSAEVLRPTASVVVQINGSIDEAPLDEETVQRFVANGVPGLDMRDVAVIIDRHINEGIASTVDPKTPVVGTSTEEPPVSSESEVTDPDAISVKKFKVIIGVVLSLFVILSGALIVVLLKLAKLRKTPVSSKAVNVPAISDKANVDNLLQEIDANKKKTA